MKKRGKREKGEREERYGQRESERWKKERVEEGKWGKRLRELERDRGTKKRKRERTNEGWVEGERERNFCPTYTNGNRTIYHLLVPTSDHIADRPSFNRSLVKETTDLGPPLGPWRENCPGAITRPPPSGPTWY